MNNLETLLNAETLHEMDSKSALSVIKVQFERSTDTPLEQYKTMMKRMCLPMKDDIQTTESLNDTYVLEKDDSNVTPDSS
ncbi:hypothetical protein Tco_1187231 [Tanacetum coccineum]